MRSTTRYGADHLPRTGSGRPGGVPTRPGWARNDRTTSATVDSITDDELRDRLDRAGLRANVVDDLVRDRRTAGARWRSTQELGL